MYNFLTAILEVITGSECVAGVDAVGDFGKIMWEDVVVDVGDLLDSETNFGSLVGAIFEDKFSAIRGDVVKDSVDVVDEILCGFLEGKFGRFAHMDDASDCVELGGDIDFLGKFVDCPLEVGGAKIIEVGGVYDKFVSIG